MRNTRYPSLTKTMNKSYLLGTCYLVCWQGEMQEVCLKLQRCLLVTEQPLGSQMLKVPRYGKVQTKGFGWEQRGCGVVQLTVLL